jgi:NADPH2:quinone reductase
MRAAVITHAGGPEVLAVREADDPFVGEGMVLVRVRASALNRADLLQREGRYPAPPGAPPDIPGLEFAGEVAERGKGAKRWREGQRVFGIIGGGAHAEYVAAHEDTLAEVPENLNWSEAAAVPEAFITAHDALWTQAGLRAGENVLIHAVGSGVGLAAVQLVRARGAVPFGTSRTADKIERARGFGLQDGAALRDPAELKPHATRWTDGRGFDVCLDLVGGAYVKASIGAMALQGRVLLVGTVAGPNAELPLGLVLSKRLTLRGTVLRARTLEEKIAATQAFVRDVLPLLASGKVQPVVDCEFSLEQVADAHRYMESNESFGKIVLRLRQ